jgi:hypothetical protein
MHSAYTYAQAYSDYRRGLAEYPHPSTLSNFLMGQFIVAAVQYGRSAAIAVNHGDSHIFGHFRDKFHVLVKRFDTEIPEGYGKGYSVLDFAFQIGYNSLRKEK